MKITDLNGHWLKAEGETFDALVKAGYKAYLNTRREDKGFFVIHELDGCADVFHTVSLEFDTEGKQAYHHNGEFYTIDGEWLVDAGAQGKGVSYSEQVNTAHGAEKRYFKSVMYYDDKTDKAHLVEQKNVSEPEFLTAIGEKNCTDADKWQAISDYIDSRPAEQKEGARLMLERLKPEVERLQTRVDELERKQLKNTGKRHRCADALHLLAEDTNLLIEYYTPEQTWHKGSFYVIDKADRDDTMSIRIKNNDKIIWSTMQAEKETDPHAKIKAQYAEAKEAEKNGTIVKVFGHHEDFKDSWVEVEEDVDLWRDDVVYELRFFEIDWNKVLETSYRDGEFIECEFTHHSRAFTGRLIGYVPSDTCSFKVQASGPWSTCSLPKDTEIKNEWLKEIKR